jgi:UDP-glucuronate 4-epimerase
LFGYTYAHLYGIPVHGPALFHCLWPLGPARHGGLHLHPPDHRRANRSSVFNRGEMWRDFTYIDDIVNGVVRVLDRPPVDDRKNGGVPPHRIYNLGNHRSEKLTDFIAEIEQALQRKAKVTLEPMQPGDVAKTYADIAASRRDLGFEPSTPISVGIPKFIDWYKDYYGV